LATGVEVFFQLYLCGILFRKPEGNLYVVLQSMSLPTLVLAIKMYIQVHMK